MTGSPVEPGAAPGAARGGGPCVLVVEDDPDLVALLELILADAGYRVRTAREGRAALACVTTEMPALILLDMRMPGMNGWDFAREFRARHHRAAPIVVLTAAENAKARADEIGAEGWLAKPFSLEDVLSVADRHVRRDAAAGSSP